jgi:hypothetical protein
MEGSFSTTKASALVVSTEERHGVAVDALIWEHFCERVEEMDTTNLDEGTFFAGTAGVFVAMVVSLVGVLLGTKSPSPYLIGILVGLLFTSGVLTYFFYRQYDAAKSRLRKSGDRIAGEMRDIANAQRLRETTEEQWGEIESSGLRVLAARYGGGNTWANVTGQLNNLIQDNRLDFIVDNATMGGDPLPGIGKVLLVRWRSQGIERSVSFLEGTHVALP